MVRTATSGGEAGLRVAYDPEVRACTAVPGTTHDWRPFTYESRGAQRVSLRCVWCSAVACGSADHPDPCLEPYHHQVDHRSRFGVTWPVGGTRPE